MDKSGSNKSAIAEINDAMEVSTIIRQAKYLNNVVEQDHRSMKQIAKPMLGYKSFNAEKNVQAGIEPIHIIRKG